MSLNDANAPRPSSAFAQRIIMKSIKLLLLASLLVFTGCDAKNTFTTIKQSIDEDTIWVFAQINIPVEDDKIEDYYYY